MWVHLERSAKEVEIMSPFSKGVYSSRIEVASLRGICMLHMHTVQSGALLRSDPNQNKLIHLQDFAARKGSQLLRTQ